MFKSEKSKEKKYRISGTAIKKTKELLRYMKPYRGQFFIGWVFLVFSSFIGLLFPLLMGQLLGSGSEQTGLLEGLFSGISLDSINSVAVALFILFASQSIVAFFRIYFFNNVTENTLRDFRKDAFTRLIYMPMDFFNANKVGELTSRVASDITKIQETLRTTIAEFFRQMVIVIGGLIFLFMLSWKLALIMLATVPVMALVAVFFGKFIRKLSREAQDEAARSNSIIEESLMGISNVKSFTNEALMLKKYAQHNDAIRNLSITSGLWRGIFVSFIIFCLFGAIVFIVWQGLLMTQGPNPELATKDFYSFIMFTIMMGTSFGSIPDMYANIQKAIGSVENLVDLMHEDGERELHKGTEKPQITGQVRFNNVHFSYPQRKDIAVLKGISFDINRNEKVALVGPSGAGKSTIASLLLNYYPLSNGNIEFDGVDLSKIDLEHLRKHLSIVPQDVILFSGSILDNIAFGKPESSREEIIDAAKKANAWEFIASFPEELDTQVGDRGIQLSGGQKQRIAIARAILNDPKILILDEATSALDSESEKLVQQALDLLMKDRTSLIIAHRLSTIRNADRILVLQEGQIAESGKHEDLLQKKGIYASLVSLQQMVH